MTSVLRKRGHYWTLGLILEAGIVNALTVTVIAALTNALFSGAGFEYADVVSWHPIALVKATVWLCPFTAITWGPFGLFAGIGGSGLLYLRARQIRSTKRFVVEAVILGFLLAYLFPFFKVWTGQVQELGELDDLVDDLFITPFLGSLCALVWARFYRNRFLAAAQRSGPSAAGR